MIRLTTMTVSLIDSKPDGIKICHVEGESLVTVVVPRELLSEAKGLPSIPKRGVYYLLDEDHGVIGRVYAGQTTQGLARLDAHKSRKDFWNKAVMFLDNEANMDRDVLDALEAEAIRYVRTHGDYETDNADTPKPYMNPYKEQTVRRLHGRILFRMAALGYDLGRHAERPVASDHAFHPRKGGIDARGEYDDRSGSFTVLAGSDVDLDTPVRKNAGAAEARRHAFGPGAAGVMRLPEDVTFRTPSAAAVFVLGGSRNGWVEWVDQAGRTLADVYRPEKG